MTGNDWNAAQAPASSTGEPLAQHSRFVQRVRRRYAPWLGRLPAGLPGPLEMATLYASLQQDGHDTPSALRILRHLVLERLVVLDCEQGIGLEEVTRTMTGLAEFALEQAGTESQARLNALHGQPLDDKGHACAWWILGMGKLGARELNVSSDIDLIYVYDQDGETAGNQEGRHQISNHEYFAKLVRAISSLLSENTDHGLVFRVDLALRPNGNSGPAAISLSALEEYFLVQGREWERFAWLKSRVVAPAQHQADGSGQSLRAIVLPFVFRRYLDYSVFDALRQLHQQIREHASRRSAGRPSRSQDVKLARGGIRELEFIVQLLQVVRGGQFPELRTRPTLDALERLARASLMPASTAQSLAKAYVFLRQLEHRIQYLDDQQTHILPEQPDDLDWLARSMGQPSLAALMQSLEGWRELVAKEFDTLLGGAPASSSPGNGSAIASSTQPPPELETLLAQLPARLRDRVAAWRDHARVRALRDESQVRLMHLLARTAQWLHEGLVQEEAAVRWVEWIEPLLRRESYLALLLERPMVHERLLKLLGTARWPARYLLQHPGVIDELAGRSLLTERFMPLAFEAELDQRLLALMQAGEDDEESLLNLLRRAHHAEVFRTLARDVEGMLSVEQVADDLSALADAVLRVAIRWCWLRLKKRHREYPQLAVIGYGKLGGKELGYGSDLDIVFVYEDQDESAAEVYATLVRKLINWLTIKTGEGDLYEIDTALRPNGNSGLLVTSFTAYANYQLQRGSNTAWTWEHQAMTRARFVLGEPDLRPPQAETGVPNTADPPAGADSEDLRQRFDAVRQAVICAVRDPQALREEILAMREKVRAAHPVPQDRFDLKHSTGGMVDVEFAVQYLVLAHAAHHPALSANVGNIALLHLAESCGLLQAGTGGAAASAYRELRRLQHRARLNEEATQLAADTLHQERAAVLALWRAVFAAPASA
ncbi:MAG: bifunctional [glutamate--ammonia ligase]-adenylyl-L-tyrosine phosphorylase/[glutamate--ammonia-ligase] adenylyltransferase [Hylemonella sp.]